jgi:hypothetical protein
MKIIRNKLTPTECNVYYGSQYLIFNQTIVAISNLNRVDLQKRKTTKKAKKRKLCVKTKPIPQVFDYVLDGYETHGRGNKAKNH